MCRLFVRMHQPRIAGNIGHQYRSQPPCDAIAGSQVLGIRIVHPSFSDSSPLLWSELKCEGSISNECRPTSRICGCRAAEFVDRRAANLVRRSPFLSQDSFLFGEGLAGTTEFGRKILQLRQSITHAKFVACCDPDVIRTASGFQRLKALTGPSDHDRHERQWQYPMASGDPVTSISTAPQKQLPIWVMMHVSLQKK